MSDTPETDAQLTSFTSISKLKKHFVNRRGTVSADFARRLERERDDARNCFKVAMETAETYKRERDDLQDQRDLSIRMAKERERERDEAWLMNQCDETCCEMIKLVAKYARERMQ